MISMFCLQANTERPAWTEEELQARGEVFTDLGEAGGFSDAGLKKQIMVDRSAPVVNGEQEDTHTAIYDTSSIHDLIFKFISADFIKVAF